MCLFFHTVLLQTPEVLFFSRGKGGLVQILEKKSVLMQFDLKLIIL